jgi:hypothetical protein
MHLLWRTRCAAHDGTRSPLCLRQAEPWGTRCCRRGQVQTLAIPEIAAEISHIHVYRGSQPKIIGYCTIPTPTNTDKRPLRLSWESAASFAEGSRRSARRLLMECRPVLVGSLGSVPPNVGSRSSRHASRRESTFRTCPERRRLSQAVTDAVQTVAKAKPI